jgi:hypothetical protein
MPDLEINQLANALLHSMKEQYRREGLQIGQSFPQAMLNHAIEPLGRDIEPELGAQFATGYDSGSGTTIMAFTTDVSILYGDGVSGDMLTG